VNKIIGLTIAKNMVLSNLNLPFRPMNPVIVFSIMAVLFIVNNTAQSQTTEQQWNIGVYNRNFNPPETDRAFWKTHFYKTTDESIQNGVSYKKLWYSPDSLFNSTILAGNLKTDHNKMSVIVDSKEYLLYDFTLGVGDSLRIYQFYEFEPSSVWAKILKVTDTLIHNKLLKRMEINYLDSLAHYYRFGTDIWIEGIGSLTGGVLNEGIPWYLVGPDKTYALLCYKENGVTLLQNPTYNTCYKETIFNSVKPNNALVISMFPNLVHKGEPVTIASPVPFTTLQVYNTLGKQVALLNVNDTHYQYSTANLPVGHYIVVVNGQVFKLVVMQ
jgi:hypothetical protein